MKLKMNEGFTKEEILKEFEENEFRICHGECAKCGNEDLDYMGTDYTNGDEMGHAYHCHKCDHIGKEWYTLTYLETR